MLGEILITFKTANDDILYKGESFIKKGKSDQFEITKNYIKLKFSRSKKVDSIDILTTPRSLYRYQIHKALCFYLAVAGELPSVDEVTITQDKERIILEHKKFTGSWENCKCRTRFNPKELEDIFKDKIYSKAIYTALTYWLKGQLDKFINDKFRSLWSGFNSLYGSLYSQNEYKEYEQLINFRNGFMRKEDFIDSINYLSELEEDFFEKLEWYNYIISEKSLNKGRNTDKLLRSFPDKKVNSLICKYTAGIKNDKLDVLSVIEEVAVTKDSLEIDYFIQLKFLLTKYIYLIRNRYFHGNKEYPLFLLGESESKNEEILCSILSLAVADTIKGIAKINI